MFGISLGEFLLILVIAILVIGPKDLPEVARYLIRAIAKTKQLIAKAKAELDVLGKEIGIDEIKNEIAIELANEKTRIESEVTTIIDLYGNEHQVSDLSEIRKDKNKDEIEQEISELNQKNKITPKPNPDKSIDLS
ncbi:MAG: twin-arginine translocase TatA/TatE family subunit [Pseudomonadota bacterium]